jgi:outer membrane lipoprotein-sorting protein
LKRISLCLLWVLFLFSPGLLRAQEESARILDALQKKYSGLKDYTVDVNIHFDVEGFKAPDMQAKLYFKAPDRMKIESKRIFFLPKEGGTFNPFMFNKEDFEVKILERLTHGGRNAVNLKLTPKKRKLNAQDYILTVDTDRNLIREMNASSSDGREVKALIEYGNFGDFDLPTRIELHLNVQFNESMEIRDFGPSSQSPKRVTGRVDITYSNYKVNSGLSDKIFDEAGPSKLRGGSRKETD